MVVVNEELIFAMRKFKEEFGDIVPLREIPAGVSVGELICAIYDSVEQKTNLLPDRFGFGELENNKNVLF